MDDKVPNQNGDAKALTMGFFSVCGLGLASLLLIRTGYEMGISQSRKILRRHDKDYRRMEKREKKYFKTFFKQNGKAGP